MYEKYHTALRLMNAVISTNGVIEPETGWPVRELTYIQRDGKTRVKLHPCHAEWDILFDYVFANFAKPDTAMVDDLWEKWSADHPEVSVTQKTILLCGCEEMERLLYSMPPELAEQVFPVGIARYLLRDIRLPLNHRRLRTFKQFHDWYGPMILN